MPSSAARAFFESRLRRTVVDEQIVASTRLHVHVEVQAVRSLLAT